MVGVEKRNGVTVRVQAAPMQPDNLNNYEDSEFCFASHDDMVEFYIGLEGRIAAENKAAQ